MVAPRLFAAAFVLGALLAALPAAAKLDPAHRWRTAETPHFVIHFHEGCDDLAARAARLAEEAHAALSPRVGWTPRARTQLIIADDADAAAGWATPYPYNQILITATPPLGEPGLGTTRRDDWLRLVVTHEYAHVLQLDMVSRLPRLLQRVFGRIYFPNALQPLWLIEGLATFEETELTAGGRGRSPGSEMVLRMAALEGPFPTLDQMAVLPDAWPGGQVPYLFGESFLRYLSERFGRESVAGLSRLHGGRAVPFLIESTGRRVLGAEYRDLWREWADSLRERFRAQRSAVDAAGPTQSAALTGDGRFNGAPTWSPDGRRIAWLRSDGRGYPGIWVMEADGSRRRRLVKSAFSTTSSGSTLSWSRDGSRLYYTRPEIVRGAASFNDIWAWDFGRGREVRITRGLRARDPDLSPDGRTLALVTARRGLTQLALLDLDGPLPARESSRLRPLTDLTAEQYAQPRWSPDGTRLAVSVWSAGGGQDIRILGVDGRVLGRAGWKGALDGGPAWSADGRQLFFSSDVTGIYNLFVWEAATNRSAQLTNVLGGAFFPASSPDGRRLAFTGYTARGFDIRVADLASLAAAAPAAAGHEPPAAAVAPGAAGTAPDAENAPPPSRPYSPRDTVLPRFWLPWSGYSASSGTLLGFVTGGQDVLQRHLYTLAALYAPQSGRLMHVADYAYDGLRPTLRLASSDIDRTYTGLFRDDDGSVDYTERARAVGVEARLDVPGFASSQAVSLGYRYRELSGLGTPPPGTAQQTLPAVGGFGSSRLGWSFSSARLQPLAISPAEGRRVELGVERYQKGFGSELSYTRFSLDWGEYVALPWARAVLATRLYLGGANGRLPQQGVFGLGGDSPGDIAHELDDRALPLRGFKPNTFRGERALLAGLEYRFPLFDIGRGGVSAPLFLRRLHGALFVDAGNAWDGDRIPTDVLHTGVGAEIRLDLFFSYSVPLTVRLGVAAGLDERGGVYPTLGIWMPQGLLGSATTTRGR